MIIQKNIKKINFGLQILRLLLSFWVVMHHFIKKVNRFSGRFHVPTFLIISFYLFYNNLIYKNIKKLNQRLERILIPYILWPFIIYITNNLFLKYFSFSQFNHKLLLKDLLYQIIFGIQYHIVFYYQFNLILFTIFFDIISILFNKKFLFILQILGITSYIFQYSNLNYNIFFKYPYAIKFSIGHISELLPFAITGVNLAYLDIINKIKNFKIYLMFFCLIWIIFLLKFKIFIEVKGFWYPGIKFNLGGMLIFIFFSLISFKNKKILLIIEIITKFTGGVYYIHFIVYYYLSKIYTQKIHTIFGSIIIYIICYLICLIGTKLFSKNKLKYLFN